MATVKIFCEPGESIEEVKSELIKSFSSTMDGGDKFADPVMEEVLDETSSWFNFFFSKMFAEIAEELSGDLKE